MPIHQTKKQDDLEKRLRILRSQVYGKPNLVFKTPSENILQSSQHSTGDLSYLHQDLIKILALASIALGIMIGLKFLNF